MSQTEPGARPTEITVAGGVVAGAAVMLVVAIFDSLGQLRSIDMRDRITKALASGQAKSLGLSVDQATTIIHGCLLVAGAAAAAAAVLGLFVLQRHRVARIALTVVAVPILLTAPFSQSLLAMLVVVGTAMLWTRPSRDWFAGRPPAPRPERPARPAPRPDPIVPPYLPPPNVEVRAPDPSAPQPPPSPGWGAAPPAEAAAPYGPPADYWPPPNPYAVLPRTTTPGRPSQVRLACILTWIFSGFTGIVFAATTVGMAVDRSGFIRLMRQSPEWKSSYNDSLVGPAVIVSGCLFLLWCIAACVLAVLVWRGTQWAWILLIISTVIATLVSLLAAPWSLPILAVLALCLGRLLSKPARAWFETGQRR